MTVALFGITNDALNLVVNLLILFLVVLWFALDRVDLSRREPADPGSGPGRLCHRRFAVPVSRHDRLLDPASARVPRRQARARTRDPGVRAAGATARGGVVSQLRAPGRAQLSALPELPSPDQGSVRVVWQADRPALVGLPVLRDAGPPRGPAQNAAPSAGPRAASKASKRAALTQAKPAPRQPVRARRGRPQAPSASSRDRRAARAARAAARRARGRRPPARRIAPPRSSRAEAQRELRRR